MASRGTPCSQPDRPTAIECKWKAAACDTGGLAAFRRLYPDGPNLVVATDVDTRYARSRNGLEVECLSLEALIDRLSGEPLVASGAG